jgi:hypothetical protein
VEFNNAWAWKNSNYSIEIFTKEQALEENSRIEAIPVFAPGLSPSWFVFGVLLSDDPGTDHIPKD